MLASVSSFIVTKADTICIKFIVCQTTFQGQELTSLLNNLFLFIMHKYKRKFALEQIFSPSTMYNTYSVLSLGRVFISLNLCSDFTGQLKAKWWCHSFFYTLSYSLVRMVKVWMWVRHDGSAWVQYKGGISIVCLSTAEELSFLIQLGNSYCVADIWKPLALRVAPGLEHSDSNDLRSSCLPVCVRYVCVGVSEWVRHTWTLQDYIFELEVQLQSGLPSSFLLWIGAQRAFLSCESEDKGHWLNSKLTLDPLWFRGLSHVCTHIHRHIMHHRSPEKRPPIYLGIFI